MAEREMGTYAIGTALLSMPEASFSGESVPTAQRERAEQPDSGKLVKVRKSRIRQNRMISKTVLISGNDT